MSAGDVTARSVLELRESMIETTMDDRWCARSVCEDAIEALEASRAEVDALRSGEAVATPPNADTVPPVETEFKREDRYIVIKRSDLERHATPAQLRELERTCEMIRFGRMNEGKRRNSYVVVADDWPEYEETWARIQARMTGTQIQGIRPPFRGEVVATPPTDVVAVPREEWERLQKFERDTKEADSRVCSDCAHYRRSQSCPGCTHPESPQNSYAFDWSMAQRCPLYALRSGEAQAVKEAK